ncbi:MAG: glycosyltransferase [Bryobacterales bacterium]|nr:glycosyltransferase [Bryobacterales bacterium]
MRILFLSPRQCWPPHGGAKIREYHFLRTLAALGEVTYTYFADRGSAPLSRDDLPFVAEIVAVPKPKAYEIGQLVRGIAGRWPLSVLNYSSPEMKACVERLTHAGPFDVTHVDSIHLLRYANHNCKRVVYNWHNIESEAMRRYGESVRSPARRWYSSITAAKLHALERDILGEAFGHVVCSERERCVLHKIAPNARIAVIENGVDCAYFSEPDGSTPLDSLVFIARLENVANALAASTFARTIWPRIRERMPRLRLMLVGAEPLPAVQQLASLPGVEVTGTVADVRPYYRRAVAAVVPLLSGSGTRLKILEAMAARVPVISTAVGAEGLDAISGKHLLIAEPEDPEAWTRHITAIAANESRDRICEAALEFVKARYDWDMLERKLKTTYENWFRERT